MKILNQPIFHCVLILFFLCETANSRAIIDDSYCNVDGYPSSKRQTILVIDGKIISPEIDGPTVENQKWRRFAIQFLDNSDPLMRQRVGARERITIVVANGDGSGITPFFSGCAPLFSGDEEVKLDAETTNLQRFFGNDWRSRLSDAGERFVTGATLALVENVQLLPESTGSKTSFRESALVLGLSKSPIVSLENGLPRVIIYTDLDNYHFPSGEISSKRATARADAEKAGINLSYAEVHLFGIGRNQVENAKSYLSAFFLSSRGHLATLASKDGAMANIQAPLSVSYYQGSIDFPEVLYPLRLRLAVDQNGSLVNSWIEMQSSVPKFVPVFGVLSCRKRDRCRFIGDNVFAQVWDDNPDERPDLQSWQPFGGMRSLEFELIENGISGRIKDELGYISGREDGLEFKLEKIEGALF